MTRQQEKLLQAIRDQMNMHPHLRFGQLISNVLFERDPYYVTDAQMIELLESYNQK